jgi:type I restriction enzyme S subunit
MDLVKIMPKDQLEPEWFYGMLRYSSFSAEVREEATGATVLHLRPKHIEIWKVIVPPHLLRSLFATTVRDFLDQKDNLELQIEKLAQARELLLPRLMNGEIPV